jgi:hypothetical protein
MTEAPLRDWFDHVTKIWIPLAVPLSITIVGTVYSCQTHQVDQAQQERDRDTALLKDLTSANPGERQYGLVMIKGLIAEKHFPADLLPAMTALSMGMPSDPVTQTAADFVSGSPKQVPTQQQPAAPVASGPAVYIQFRNEAQRCNLGRLRTALMRAGFAVPAAEQVANGPDQTSVRFFSDTQGGQAKRVAAAAASVGLHPSVSNFSASTSAPLSQIEVWFGPGDGPPGPAGSGTLLTEDCEPFVIGKSPLGGQLDFSNPENSALIAH